MKRILPAIFLLAIGSIATADIPVPTQATQEPILGHGDGGATGFCSLAYYDYCSGWLWVYDSGPGYWSGVVYDLPEDCGKPPGEAYTNTHFWWYWRYTWPGREFVDYRVYEADSMNCLVGEPLLEVNHFSPLERWNYHSGFGSSTADHVAFIARAYWGSVPRMASDNNVWNQAVGCGTIPTVFRSFRFIEDDQVLCPPVPFEDPLGPVNILTDAGFDCETTGIEPASWGGVKSLFR